jgi:SAM-dependent methyltransferase
MSNYGEEYFDDRQPDDARRQAMRVQEVERVRERTGLSGGTVVDVGCGLGELLDLFPAERWQRFGIEPASHARAVCESAGISFYLPSDEGWCDLVLLRGSLQHLDRPLELLSNAYRWLRPGGWLVALATPNTASVVYRLFQDLPALDPPRNFVLFSDRMLRQILVNIGFSDVNFHYPYLGTPYASPLRDHVSFGLRLLGRRGNFAFWRNMMECYARKG